MKQKKKPYPKNSDIAKAIIQLLSLNPLVKPEEFVDSVKSLLERNGFYVKLVTPKRVWRIYENMVKKGQIYDYLLVVKEKENTFT